MIFVSQLNHSRFPCLAKGLFSFFHPLILPMSQKVFLLSLPFFFVHKEERKKGLQDEPAVSGEDLAGNEGGGIACEE